ncbi:unnamed protein product [Kuraishia capsulata CBS 1993]|uniref:Uncharacterized protein n=1 Tax=Kuraishia capsulata CBS 1993 TaxID=1382522 RepID=W6MPQ6_9ASCO|nr:uncharacterized protein KUCA_T00004683001 [Kuraishia capsulata CBS 1993]CDK28699.1 unnamed protein product [Kuraishia capsulata CBS 1993]
MIFAKGLFILAMASSAFSEDTEEAKTLAAEYDFDFLVAFLNDFSSNIARYTSYMVDNSMTYPRQLVQFYNDVYTYTDYGFTTLVPDQFPFSEFQTFISEFPWYTTLLKEGDITAFAVPADYLTTDVTTSTSESSESSTTTTSESSTSKSSSSKTSSSKTSSVHSKFTTSSSKSAAPSTSLTSITTSSSVSLSKSHTIHSSLTSSILSVLSSYQSKSKSSTSFLNTSSIPATESYTSNGVSRARVYPWIALAILLMIPFI